MKRSKKRGFLRRFHVLEPLQNRGSRVRILLPLPNRKAVRKSGRLFCLAGAGDPFGIACKTSFCRGELCGFERSAREMTVEAVKQIRYERRQGGAKLGSESAIIAHRFFCAIPLHCFRLVQHQKSIKIRFWRPQIFVSAVALFFVSTGANFELL